MVMVPAMSRMRPPPGPPSPAVAVAFAPLPPALPGVTVLSVLDPCTGETWARAPHAAGKKLVPRLP